MKDLLLAIDQGTTGSTALIINSQMEIVAKSNVEFPQHFPESSWVEHDLEEIWASVKKSVEQALENGRVSPSQIAAIGITNQRETTCVWEKSSGRPIGRAIVWQDRRTSSECEKLKKRGLEKFVSRKTGLLLDPYFSGTKLQWILKNRPEAASLAKSGRLAFGTVESFLLNRLTGEHATDVTNASRTLLMDIKKLAWDEELLKLFKIPESVLPEIHPTAHIFGKTKNFLGIPNGTPVAAMIGDQQSALFGQACFTHGATKCTYGTGAFAVANTGDKPFFSKYRLLTTVAWKIGKKTTYALEGSSFIAGAAVQWLRDGLKFFSKSSDIEDLARSVESSDGVIIVPAYSGLGAPHWVSTAKGITCGITRRTTKGHIARATLEGIAFQVRELVSAMSQDYGKKLNPLKVDGGASENNLMMQFQADILGVEVVRPKIVETTALGAALMAGLSIGMWRDTHEIEKYWKADAVFKPKMQTKQKQVLLKSWNNAVEAVKLLSVN